MTKDKELITNLLEKVKASGKQPTLVLTEGWDERGLKAAEFVVKEGIAKIVLLDQGNNIEAAAKEFNVDASQFTIFDIQDEKNIELKKELSEILLKKREHKGMTIEKALELVEDENYFGACLVLAGKADAFLGSLIRSTGDMMKPALQLLRKGLVSETMIIYDPKRDKIFFGSDASLNISPNADQLAEMAINASGVASLFGYDPVVGMLSFSTKGSGGDTPETQLVREAIVKAKELRPRLKIGGEYQFDAAVSEHGAERKCKDDDYAGKVNTFVFPNLTTSNIFCHGMMQFSDLVFMFTIMKGTIKPVVILGRSTPAELVNNMFLVAAMEAIEMME
jgi:phosphotransacetylase